VDYSSAFPLRDTHERICRPRRHRRINRRMTQFDNHAQVWLFGYDSLIHKADFPFVERRAASIRGWVRRF